MHRLHIGGLSLLLAQSFATPALAGIAVSVDPDPVRQCTETHIVTSMVNDTSEAMEMEVVATLQRGSKDVARLHIGRFLLAANESRDYDFEVTMPAIPQGRYDLTLHTLVNYAAGEEATTNFEVVGSAPDCPVAVPVDLLTDLRYNLTGNVAGSSPRRQNQIRSSKGSTWQEFKQLYR